MKRIVIVGASSGIGREVAELFIAKGYKVGLALRGWWMLLLLGSAPMADTSL